MLPAGLLTLALLAPAAPPAPAPLPTKGAELLYTGTVTEAVDRPGKRFRREHALEIRLFVLDRRDAYADVAVLTLLRRADDPAVAAALPAVTGAGPDRPADPPAARLDLVRLAADGTAKLLRPAGPVPLRLAADTPAGPLPPPAPDAYSPFELGMFPPNPAEGWKAAGDEFVNGEQCRRLALTRQTPEWDAPRGGVTAWQRADAVWVSAADGLARRVERTVVQRDGAGPAAAARLAVRYEFKEQARLLGWTYDRCRREIEFGYAAAAELTARAGEVTPRQLDARLARVREFLAGTDTGTPYREAVQAVRRQLEAARRGEVVPTVDGTPAGRPVPPGATGDSRPPPDRVEVGRPAPAVREGPFRPADARGTPVVLVFFMPGQSTTDLSLAVADALRVRYGGRLVVAPLAVFAPAAAGVADRDRLKLAVPVYDGTAAGEAFGVDTFPRFVLLDRGGVVRWAFAGVGAETGFLLREEIDALLNPAGVTASPVAPAGPPARPQR